MTTRFSGEFAYDERFLCGCRLRHVHVARLYDGALVIGSLGGRTLLPCAMHIASFSTPPATAYGLEFMQ